MAYPGRKLWDALSMLLDVPESDTGIFARVKKLGQSMGQWVGIEPGNDHGRAQLIPPHDVADTTKSLVLGTRGKMIYFPIYRTAVVDLIESSTDFDLDTVKAGGLYLVKSTEQEITITLPAPDLFDFSDYVAEQPNAGTTVEIQFHLLHWDYTHPITIRTHDGSDFANGQDTLVMKPEPGSDVITLRAQHSPDFTGWILDPTLPKPEVAGGVPVITDDMTRYVLKEFAAKALADFFDPTEFDGHLVGCQGGKFVPVKQAAPTDITVELESTVGQAQAQNWTLTPYGSWSVRDTNGVDAGDLTTFADGVRFDTAATGVSVNAVATINATGATVAWPGTLTIRVNLDGVEVDSQNYSITAGGNHHEGRPFFVGNVTAGQKITVDYEWSGSYAGCQASLVAGSGTDAVILGTITK